MKVGTLSPAGPAPVSKGETLARPGPDRTGGRRACRDGGEGRPTRGRCLDWDRMKESGLGRVVQGERLESTRQWDQGEGEGFSPTLHKTLTSTPGHI